MFFIRIGFFHLFSLYPAMKQNHGDNVRCLGHNRLQKETKKTRESLKHVGSYFSVFLAADQFPASSRFRRNSLAFYGVL